jgi:hypothetical protein
MFRKLWAFLLIFIAISLVITHSGYSHPGRTDGNGCHTCKTNCEEKYGIPYGYYHRHSPVRACFEESSTTTSTTIPPMSKIVVLANSIDYGLASDFFNFLENNGFETVHATVDDFVSYKEEKFIVILGGPDAPEGVGEIVQEVLSEVEENSIREVGARKKYARTNMWIQGQRVMVIAGSNRQETKNAHEENRYGVASEVAP